VFTTTPLSRFTLPNRLIAGMLLGSSDTAAIRKRKHSTSYPSVV
jgi:hypothetical protein